MPFNSEPPPPDTLPLSRQCDSPVEDFDRSVSQAELPILQVRHDIVSNSELEDTTAADHPLLHDSEARDEGVETDSSGSDDLKGAVATVTMAMSRKGKLIRVFVFLAIEVAWLVFGLICYHSVIKAPLLPLDIFGLQTSSDTFFRSILTSISVLWQLCALLPLHQLIFNDFSSEWSYQLRQHPSIALPTADRVSTLTSGLLDRISHAWHRRASTRYYLVFAASLALLVLQPVAPGVVTVGLDTVEKAVVLSVGAMPLTIPTVDTANYETLLAEALLVRATHFVYVSQVEHLVLNYDLPPNVLFGLPPSGNLSSYLRYKTDAVFFDFKCQYLAPTYSGIGGSMNFANWTFGGDTIGSLDRNAAPDSVAPRQFLSGFWPLTLLTGPGVSNGSFAWLIIGNALVDLSPLSPSTRTYNASGWYDLVMNIQASAAGEAATLANMSTTASVLFCDPGMRLGSVDVTLQSRALSVNQMGTASAGTIDPAEASRMLGRSLNGMVYDQVLAPTDAAAAAQGLSRLAYEFLLASPPSGSIATATFISCNPSITSPPPLIRTPAQPRRTLTSTASSARPPSQLRSLTTSSGCC
ncbi:hypothetical protein FIBSPDRAFT_257845 [Athelia psychrophila]|uniref:Uncharacterized protein n=1 Tax=Athelia psychrophila TaxID=1759441 RepID=A0A166RKC0_9AGAM|nr:hypothetical protein FIBSPDRAFT_257845 [Fibularhizoctonia sp. CBS 109695]